MQLTTDVLAGRLQLSLDQKSCFWGHATHVARPRDLTQLHRVEIMPESYLETLMRHVPLQGTRERIYALSLIHRERLDPQTFLIGQTFVERGKYQRLIENQNNLLEGFCLNHGFAKCVSLILHGTVQNGIPVIAHYLPPIVEEHKGRFLLVDGCHRGYLTRGVGTTIESIVIRECAAAFPCDPQSWKSICVVETKPALMEDRFRNFIPDLFRDLKYVGIDG